MDWKIVDVEERTDFDRHLGFLRHKLVRFTVNKAEHTLKISMKDFEADKTNELVEREVHKIINIFNGSGIGKTGK